MQTCRRETSDVPLCHDAFMCGSTTAGAIVAGGGARRFGGQDKGRLVVEGRTIIVRQVEVLQRVASELLIVAPDAARFADLPVTVVSDRQPGLGAIGGIDAALHATALDQVIVIACDLPFLTSDLLRHLVVLSAGHDGAWVRTSRGVEPLIACYRAAARARVAAYIDAGGRKAAGLGNLLHMAELTSPDLDRFGAPDQLLANINTPDDYARVQYGSA
jgi:molybdopterin-guanine dinucleotide biosynthesis protein A